MKFSDLINLSKEDLFKYALNIDEYIYCDSNEELDLVVKSCNSFLPDEFKVLIEEIVEAESFLISNASGQFKLTLEEGEDADEMIFSCIEKINVLNAPSHQIRRFLITDGTDCLSFYLKTSTYWTASESAFPDEIYKFFERVEQELD